MRQEQRLHPRETIFLTGIMLIASYWWVAEELNLSAAIPQLSRQCVYSAPGETQPIFVDIPFDKQNSASDHSSRRVCSVIGDPDRNWTDIA
jgi:hypothetical protein